MLYPKNNAPKISEELFKNPTSEYRCTPFWAWNCDLKGDELLKEIDFMKEMGMGGFHIHTRVGMSTTYLSDEYMALAKLCNEKAKKEQMLSWLYDEDKWPSGFGGGYVTRDNIENRAKYIFFTSVTEEENEQLGGGDRGKLLGKYDVVLDNDGYMTSYKMINEGDVASGRVWYAYMQTAKSSPRYNFGSYVDTLSKPAIDEFIRITHERYKEVLGDEFGRSVPAIFTDEPQYTSKGYFSNSRDREELLLPYTTDFEDTYKAEYGVSFLKTLPEIFWDVKGEAQTARYRYHNHVADRFAQAYGDNIGDWCEKNGILLTGHVMVESQLSSQTKWCGECMRSMRKFGIPGIDILCDAREFTTAKQAASLAHQYGRSGVMSELYGVTNWDFDFKGHKLQGDWQAALGVTVRVPHLYWVNMKGESKRDYPASIGHQSSWYNEYSFIEDHFARVNTLMTRGTPDIKIAVVHPIESLFMEYGADDVTGETRRRLEKEFADITNWLLLNNLDFDYVSEALIPELYEKTERGFKIGKMTYDVVVIPGCRNIRRTTLNALSEFAAIGGKLILVGDAPKYVDAQFSDDAKSLASVADNVEWDENKIASALKDYVTVSVNLPDGTKTKDIICGMRQDGDGYNLFVCHAYNPDEKVIVAHKERYKVITRERITPAVNDTGYDSEKERYVITVKGELSPILMDTQTGDIKPISARYEGGNTLIDWECYAEDSILLRLEKGRSNISEERNESNVKTTEKLGTASVALAEDNVLVLDMAKWKVDDGDWQDKEENLRLTIKAKEALNISTAADSHAQPWAFPPIVPKNKITTEFIFNSEIEVENAFLAIEDREISKVIFNGKELDRKYLGYYVDFSIHKIELGKINAGENVIVIEKPFGAVSNVENIYILGDFGTKAEKDQAVITAPIRTLDIGDWTKQGLTFYGGKLALSYKINGGRRLKLKLGKFRAPCIIVKLDGKRITNVSLAPHTADLGYLTDGEHTLEIEISASRINTFGPLHITDAFTNIWYGPKAWRTTGEEWSYDYFIKPSGILTAPELIEYC